MVPVGSRVQVPKQGSTFLGGDASLEDARWASSVQLAVAKDVSFGSSREPLGLGPVRREHSSNEAIKEWNSPVRTLIGLGRSCVDFHGLGSAAGVSAIEGASGPVVGSIGGPSSTAEA